MDSGTHASGGMGRRTFHHRKGGPVKRSVDAHGQPQRDPETYADRVAEEHAPAAHVPGLPVLPRLGGLDELLEHLQRRRDELEHAELEQAAGLPDRQQDGQPSHALPERPAPEQPIHSTREGAPPRGRAAARHAPVPRPAQTACQAISFRLRRRTRALLAYPRSPRVSIPMMMVGICAMLYASKIM